MHYYVVSWLNADDILIPYVPPPPPPPTLPHQFLDIDVHYFLVQNIKEVNMKPQKLASKYRYFIYDALNPYKHKNFKIHRAGSVM